MSKECQGCKDLLEALEAITARDEHGFSECALGSRLRDLATAAIRKATESPATPSGVERIAAERRRQTDVEGWTAGHDDEHVTGDMAAAAACYALRDRQWWPWADSWWKPTPEDRVRELAKAGALIAAPAHHCGA